MRNDVIVAAFVSAVTLLSACMVGDDEEDIGDDDLSLAAGRKNHIRVANVNIYKGAFGEVDGTKHYDGRNFLHYLAGQQYAPDIFTVQNLDHSGNGFHDCREVANKLARYLEPAKVSYAIYNPSEHGGGCVIYRSDRFERLGEVAGLGAWNGPGCDHKGMESVGVHLRDKKKNKTVSVISVHMPGQCTRKNTEELRQWSNATNADIRIIAGDFNTRFEEGYGSVPAMTDVLSSNGYRAADVWGVLDWIWRKGQSEVSNAKRVEYSEATGPGYPSALPYSDHRGGFEDLKY